MLLALRIGLTIAFALGAFTLVGALGAKLDLKGPAVFTFVFFGVLAPALVAIWKRVGSIPRRVLAFGVGFAIALTALVFQASLPSLWTTYPGYAGLLVQASGIVGALAYLVPGFMTWVMLPSRATATA